VIATLLGAEEWGVATAALVVMGCIMMRKCHVNTCPVGVATQNPELRAMFTGNPDDVVNLFRFLAMEVREYMAELGFRTIDEMVGQVDKLEMRDDLKHWKYRNLDLSALLHKEPTNLDVALYKQEEQDHGLADQVDWALIAAAKPALENLQKVSASFDVINVNRTIGTMLSNEITKAYGSKGLPKDTIHFKFKGTAGQSFGAFAVNGIKMELEGDANDYVGKGLCGAELIIYPDKKATFDPSKNSIIGNVCFYGATSGEAYLRGMGGERFAVRNSGAKVVVEGIGDHGCEYMTGGLVIVLGDTGRNFGAGMSGGVAYIWDKNGDFDEKLNKEMVALENLTEEDHNILRLYIQNHIDKTGSINATKIIENWADFIPQFKKVMPIDFKKALISRSISLSEQLADKNVVYQDIQVVV
jgi:glutamate synthase (NADPH/NADH) large chain